MKFLHIADIHLGAEPNAGKAYSQNRAREIWNSFEQIIYKCNKVDADLLLIAGDLFHRQPLLGELKEVNSLFSALKRTKVVLIAGNHDYIKADSYYRTFKWNKNVYPLLRRELSFVEFKELKTCVYGCSYYQKEIRESIYDQAYPGKRQKFEILLAHGGSERQIPVKKENLEKLGYHYIAMGHIHKPGELKKNQIAYAGALEPIDINDTGKHGYIIGQIDENGTKIRFVTAASREYVHLEFNVDCKMTNNMLKAEIKEIVEERGIQNIYKFILKGTRDPDILFDRQSLDYYGNIVEISDQTCPAYNFQRLLEQNKGNLLGRYIESLIGYPEDSIERKALYEGVRALTMTKRG